MSHKIKENIEELRSKMKALCEEPLTAKSMEWLVMYHKAYKAMCDIYGHREHDGAYKVDVSVMDGAAPHFDKKTAMEWTAGMKNADGTTGPYWSMEETDRVHAQYGLTCDKLVFYAVMNSLYSDYCEALRESSVSTPEVYVRLAKAWINDKDAVPDKAAAYYTYIVEH